MHDGAHFESQGLPSIAVCSAEFQPQAAYQARMLGFDDLRAEFVSHPISDASEEEMERKAEGAFPAILQALTTGTASALQSIQDVRPPSADDS